MTLDLSPYSTAIPFFAVNSQIFSGEDNARIDSYALYEGIFRNVPESFKIIQRGSEQNPIYIPNAKTIIEACNRYLAKRWNFLVDPMTGSPEEQTSLSQLMQKTFIREEMYSKFSTQKRWGLVRGDAVWHITADPNKPEGTRVSIHTRDPGSYFPIYDPVDDSKVVGCHLLDQFETAPSSKKYVLRRQTYRKVLLSNGEYAITYEVTWWEIGAWDDRESSTQKLKPAPPPKDFASQPAFTLPPQIQALPVYHWKNDPMPDAPFGTSEIAGLEHIFGAINQAISDEELALALEGLGVYVTNSGPPVDENGEETTWNLGPGYVLEIDQDSTWQRVQGVTSFEPVMQHIGYLENKSKESSGTPDIAVGIVDVQVAESGVALALKMAPLLSKNEEKEQHILAVTDHMLYDLSTMWFVAYESLPGNAIAVSVVDDPMPINRKAILDEVIAMLTANLISAQYAQQLLSQKLGYEFPTEMLAQIVKEQEALSAAVNIDPYRARAESELEQQPV